MAKNLFYFYLNSIDFQYKISDNERKEKKE